MQAIEIQCANCAKPFLKTQTEFNRSVKRGALHFCSLSCSCAYCNKKHSRGDASRLEPGNHRDEFTPFRWFLARCRNRQKKYGKKPKETQILLEDLRDQWLKQKGICPFTGWELELPVNTGKWENKHNPRRASLDRIDPAIGYVKGNIQFVAVMANYAKNSFTEKELLEFCRAVAEKHAKGVIE